MNRKTLRGLAALLAAALLAMPPALAEVPEDETLAVEEVFALEEELSEALEAEPEAAPEDIPQALDGELTLAELAGDDAGEAPLAEEEYTAGAEDEAPTAAAPEDEDTPEVEYTALGVDERTQAQIQAFVDAHPAYTGQVNLYSVAAQDAPYSIGRLSPVNQQSALNLLNQMRYIAGLDANLTLLAQREDMVASAALVLRLNGTLTHYPERPAALSDSMYDGLYSLGYTGAAQSNIAKGYKVTGAILVYMSDSDDENIAILGHRRWILNPTMGRTVMGANGSYSAMYVYDLSGSGAQSKVAWPAQQMPVQYFAASDPWSLSFDRALEAEQISVELERQRDGVTWHFSQEASDGFFNVDNHSYGQRGCVIFRPEGLGGIAAGDVFNVAVTDGAAGEVTRYTVNFFSLNLSAAAPLARPKASAVMTDGGNALSWNGVSGATGYYVCRRTTDTAYEIVADVTGTEWLDAAPPEGDCAYQVYAHSGSVTCATPTAVRATVPKPESVSLDESGTVKLYTGDVLVLTASWSPAVAETALTWKSSKKKVASVTDGVVEALKPGTAIISVATDNGLSASVKVKVSNPPKPKKVSLDRSGTVKLKLGKKLRLEAALKPEAAVTELTWSSSDRKVAKVSKKGVVTPVSPGTATITVKTANGKRASVQVKVVDPGAPTCVKLDRSGTVRLAEGEKLRLNATLSPATAASDLTWSSDRPKVAKVSKGGTVTALKPGTAVITVKTANGKRARVKIRVTERKPIWKPE